MRRRGVNPGDEVETHLRLFGSPESREVAGAEERTLARLRAGLRTEVATPIRSVGERRPARRFARILVPLAAAAVVALAWTAGLLRGVVERESQTAIATYIEGVLEHASATDSSGLTVGDRVFTRAMLQTRESVAALTLTDGSRVEIRPESRLWLERADDGLIIHLSAGGIIVDAARQRDGHLYVQTRDVRVSVVGTVFLVKAAESGSRVAVLEGEVHVQRDATEKTLHPGEQMTTSAQLDSIPVADDLAWSPRAGTHRALLQQAQTNPQPAPPRFDVTSVKPCPAGVIRGAGGGTTGSSAGRLHLSCQQLWGLIQGAYVLFAEGRANFGRIVPIEGAADWLRTSYYTIEATAEGEPGWGMMNGPMLQALLEDRFKLKIRRETREVPVYALTMRREGLELAPLEDGACTPPPAFDFSKPPAAPEPGQKPFCRGMWGEHGPNLTWEVFGLTLDEIARGLSSRLDRPVVNRTGAAGRFAFRLEFSREAGMARVAADPLALSSEVASAPPIFTVLEEELGLDLEPARGPGEFLVIDHIEQPSPN